VQDRLWTVLAFITSPRVWLTVVTACLLFAALVVIINTIDSM
jgi:hypothetical protein